MNLCHVNPNGHCARHPSLPHVGRLLEISQWETPLGEAYRQFWDQQELKHKKDAAPSFYLSPPEPVAYPPPHNCGCGGQRRTEADRDSLGITLEEQRRRLGVPVNSDRRKRRRKRT